MQYTPEEIEARSFAIIREELDRLNADGGKVWLADAPESWVLQRVIHTSADFDYRNTLCFSQNAAELGMAALAQGAAVITDTNMALSGVSKRKTENNNPALCLMADPDVAREAAARGVTRAVVAVEMAVKRYPQAVFAIGNAPTALLRLVKLIEDGDALPALVIGVPVGFVNVVEAKERLMACTKTPYIVAKGRKGGSNIAAAIVNALLYGKDAAGIRA